jgi:hypothetical protein
MKRLTQNPLPAVESMLDSCRKDEVDFFVMTNAGRRSICVYPTSDDTFAAECAVQIADGDDPVVHAAIIGLVHLHNAGFSAQTSAAVAAFIQACTGDFYFGYGFGESN